MKISDLTSDRQKAYAVEAGKRLARMMAKIELPAAKKEHLKLSFSDFMVPKQPIMELANQQELKAVEEVVGNILNARVHCSNHFVDHAFRREVDVTVRDIAKVFERVKQQHSKSLYHAMARAKALQGTKEIEILIKDYSQDLNVTVSPKGDQFELMSLMRKPCDRFVPLTKPGIENIVLKVGVQGLNRNRFNPQGRV